jgi:hypothetical protein
MSGPAAEIVRRGLSPAYPHALAVCGLSSLIHHSKYVKEKRELVKTNVNFQKKYQYSQGRPLYASLSKPSSDFSLVRFLSACCNF